MTPVMYVDPSGTMPKWLSNTLKIAAGTIIVAGLVTASILTGGAIAYGALLGAVVSGGVGLISGISVDDNGFNFDLDKALTGFVLGIITGAISGAAGAKVGAIVKLGSLTKSGIIAGIDGTLSLSVYLIEAGIYRKKVTMGGSLISFGSGLFSFADSTGSKMFDAIWGPMMGAELAWAYDTISGMKKRNNPLLKVLKIDF